MKAARELQGMFEIRFIGGNNKKNNPKTPQPPQSPRPGGAGGK